MKISDEGCRSAMRYVWFFDGFKVYKVTREQAARFVKDDLSKLTANPLHEREWYHGYVIIDYGNGCVDVGYLHGDLSKATKSDHIRPPKGKHSKEGCAYVPSREFYKVQTFAECDFQIPWGGARNQDLVDNLKEKLVNMQANPDLRKILTGFEEQVLDDYFGEGKWKKFFLYSSEDRSW